MEKCMIGWNDAEQNASGRCCCNCKYHFEDLHHCTTMIDRIEYAIENDVPVPHGCVCSIHKGWICVPPDWDNKAYSGWSEHGMCEMWDKKEINNDNM